MAAEFYNATLRALRRPAVSTVNLGRSMGSRAAVLDAFGKPEGKTMPFRQGPGKYLLDSNRYVDEAQSRFTAADTASNLVSGPSVRDRNDLAFGYGF